MATRKASVVERSASRDGKESESTPESVLAAATEVLAQAVEVLNAAMAQPQRMGAPGIGAPVMTATQVNTWDDDPFSEAVPTQDPPVAPVIAVDLPANTNPQLQTTVIENQPPAGRYNPGTPEFRYWCAEEAMARGVNFWTPLLPAGTTWSASTNPLRVRLVTGTDLNAFYSRARGLEFYQQPVRQTTIYSAESPDIVLHELGHAILDAVSPHFWDAASLEVAAFHESFGDMTALLGSLQLASHRGKVLADTQGELSVNSRLSRFAEALAWGIRQEGPAGVDVDCLRNAANRFSYQKPELLPGFGPATQLTSAPHNFSRVFTGAFLNALALMFARIGANTEAGLAAVSTDLGQLLADAVRTAPASPGLYAQVAAGMIQSDEARNMGRFGPDLTRAYVNRGILTSASAVMVAAAPPPALVEAPQVGTLGLTGLIGRYAGAAVGSPMFIAYDNGDGGNVDYALGYGQSSELPLRSVPTSLGIDLLVHAADEPQRMNVASTTFGVAALLADSIGQANSPLDDASHFVEELIRLGRIESGRAMGIAPEAANVLAGPGATKTHEIVQSSDGPVLKRIRFNCGCRRAH